MTYISWYSDFSSFIFCSENILLLFAKRDSGELRCPATALINMQIHDAPSYFVNKISGETSIDYRNPQLSSK